MSDAVYICPPDHAHGGTTTCHSKHHCRCTECVVARTEYDRSRRIICGEGVLRPADSSMRRLRALARHGWSVQQIADAGSGVDRSYLSIIRRGMRTNVRQSTWERIDRFYREHALVILREGRSRTTARNAERRGWLGPFDWDDIEAGIIDELAHVGTNG